MAYNANNLIMTLIYAQKLVMRSYFIFLPLYEPKLVANQILWEPWESKE